MPATAFQISPRFAQLALKEVGAVLSECHPLAEIISTPFQIVNPFRREDNRAGRELLWVSDLHSPPGG